MSKYNQFFILVVITNTICFPKILAINTKPEVEQTQGSNETIIEVFENTKKTFDFENEALTPLEQIRNSQGLEDKIKITLTKIDKKTDKEDMTNEMAVLTKNIYELLLCGQTPDEITALFADNKEHVNTIQKLAVRMADLQNKQYSKGVPINLTINNKEEEKYYAKKNFWTTIENLCFVLKVIAIIVIIIMLYQYLRSSKILKYITYIFNWIAFIYRYLS
jgi:hypothetical protein